MTSTMLALSLALWIQLLFPQAGLKTQSISMRGNHIPPGAKIRGLAINPEMPDIMFAATWGGGIFLSANGGQSWSSCQLPAFEYAVQALAFAPGNSNLVYAGSTGGLYRSMNGGDTWEKIKSNVDVLALAIDTHDSKVIYAGTNGSGLIRTLDGGVNWQSLQLGPGSTFVSAAAINPSDPKKIYAGTEEGLFVSLDAGQTWTSRPGVVRALAIDPNNPELVYAAGSGIFRSDDGGLTWKNFASGLPTSYLLSLAISPSSSTVYAGSYAGLYRSTNAGASWLQEH
jgi:photosystem II stability/assembly factor-like uncharacterized protein